MRNRREFERDADRALTTATRARRQARTLARHVSSSDRLAARAALAEAINRLSALRDEAAVRLGTLRRHGRSHQAYARIAGLGADGGGGLP